MTRLYINEMCEIANFFKPSNSLCFLGHKFVHIYITKKLIESDEKEAARNYNKREFKAVKKKNDTRRFRNF